MFNEPRLGIRWGVESGLSHARTQPAPTAVMWALHMHLPLPLARLSWSDPTYTQLDTPDDRFPWTAQFRRFWRSA